MVKITPNPPRAEDLSSYTTLDTKKLREAADRALNIHLSPTPPKPHTQDGQVFTVIPGLNTESVLTTSAKPWPRPMRWSVTWDSSWRVPGGMWRWGFSS
ncbi:hypothetical protein SAMN03159290_05028 [Pseudomonas sp. NFACC13-1]|nr:hypothetical protein SAMN03159290_05028 [Pseudomonas sp. NFACC13-1]